MEKQHGRHVGDTHELSEGGGAHGVPIVGSVSHEDHLGKFDNQEGYQERHHHQGRSSGIVANIQDCVVDGLSRDHNVGGREDNEATSRNLVSTGLQGRCDMSGQPRNHGASMVDLKPLGEMTAAMESLANVKIPFPPIPKFDQIASHCRVVGQGQEPPFVGHGAGRGPGAVQQYGGVPPAPGPSQHYQYPQFHEIVPSAAGDSQDQGWRLPQFKRKEVDTMPYHASNINTPTWTRPAQQDRWKHMGAPLAQSVGPPSTQHHGYPGGLGPMGGMMGIIVISDIGLHTLITVPRIIRLFDSFMRCSNSSPFQR